MLLELLDQNLQQQLVEMVLEVVRQLTDDNQQLQNQLAVLKRQAFGRKTQKVSADQLKLVFDSLAAQVPTEARPSAENQDEQTENDPSRTDKPRKKGGRKPRRKIPDNLKRVEKVVELPENQRMCCGKPKRDIGVDEKIRVEYEPAQFVVHVERVHKYACTGCEKGVQLAPATPKPIDGGRPGCSLLADLLLKKYADHLPLHRIHRIYAREGYDIPQSTLVDWVAAGAQCLEPLAKEILRRALLADVLQTDDTGVRVLDPEHAKNVKKGHLWVYLGDQLWVAFDFTPDWKAARAQQLLENRDGPVQVDGYKGYEAVFTRPDSKAIEVGCHFHGRSNFFDASKTDKRAFIALGFYKKLYRIEQEAKERRFSDEQRRRLRQEKSRPVMNAFRQWMTLVAHEAPPKTPLGQAIRYITRRWLALTRFLDDGRLEIDNTAAERILKHPATGRRNWMFCGSDEGGQRAAIIYSIVCTCIAVGVEPRAYLSDVLRKLADGWTKRRIHELLPPFWREQAPEQCDTHEPQDAIAT